MTDDQAFGLVQAVVLLGMKHVLFKADAQDMEQVQLDLAEIKEHLGIRLVTQLRRVSFGTSNRSRAARTTEHLGDLAEGAESGRLLR